MSIKDWFLKFFFTPVSRGVVNVGFDFGTHSTKIVVRERDARVGRVVRIDKDHEGYTPGVSPSVIRIENGRMWFGTTALTKTGGELLKSLKVAVAYNRNTTAGRSTEISCAKLVAIYMAWALCGLRKAIQKDGYSRVLLNVSAPMQRLENRVLKNQYLRMVQSAWLLSADDHANGIEQGMSVTKALQLLESVWTRPLVDEQEREFDILPETIAPICSFAADVASKAGIHVMLDMGAGSTEVSVLDVPEQGSGYKVLCYCDESQLFGGNDLELAARPNRLAEDVAEVHRKLTTFYGRVWARGFEKVKAEPVARRRWKSVCIVLSGGATLNPGVRLHLEKDIVLRDFLTDEKHHRVHRHVPNNLTPLAEMQSSDLTIFAVANGLAVDRAKFTSFDPPDSLAPMDGPPEEEKTPDYWDCCSN